MQNTIITYKFFSNPEIEGFLTSLRTTLYPYCKLQGRQDGRKDIEIIDLTFQVKIVGYVHSSVQHTIDRIIQTLLVASYVITAKEYEQEALRRYEQFQLDIDDKEHAVAEIEAQKKSCVPDRFNITYGKWLLPLAIIAGLFDGVLSFSNYRHEYSFWFAFIAAIAIAAVVGITHLFYTSFICTAPTRQSYILRSSLVVLAAAIFFYVISGIRVDSINNAVDISLTDTPTMHVSRWPIFIISMALFLAVFAGALRLWKNKEEQAKEAEYTKLCADSAALTKEIAIARQTISDLKDNVQRQKREARDVFDYCKKSIRRAKHIGDGAITAYKQSFAANRATIPPFFTTPIDLTYNEDLHFSPIDPALL